MLSTELHLLDLSHIEEVRMDSLVAPVFKLTDLVNLYSTRLEQLGTHVTGRIHSIKLKNRILSYTSQTWMLTSKVVMWSLCVQ